MLRLALFLTLIASTSLAEPACGPHDMVKETLSKNYGETVQTTALTSEGQVITFFANDETQSWTLTTSSPNGITCLVSAGNAYETYSEPKGDDT